jgi:hypothetical protein
MEMSGFKNVAYPYNWAPAVNDRLQEAGHRVAGIGLPL